MKLFAPIILIPLLLVRRSLAVMYLVRAVYRASSLCKLRRFITVVFDPNSIRRHTRFSIPTRYVRVEGKLGEQLRVNLGDHIGWNIFLNGYFDLVPSLVALILHRNKTGSVYLDVGANIGDTSIGVAHRGVDTVGIDASAYAISELCHNIAINSPMPYTAVHAAVSATTPRRNGDIQSDFIKLHLPMGNTGAASVHADWNPSKSSSPSLLAPPRSVSDIVDALSIQSLCCVKLDVEGAEHDALRGMKRLLERHRCPIVFEYRLDQSSNVTHDAVNIVDLLPVGYECYAITCDQILDRSATLKISSFDRSCSYENVLAVDGALPPMLEAARSEEGLTVDFSSR